MFYIRILDMWELCHYGQQLCKELNVYVDEETNKIVAYIWGQA